MGLFDWATQEAEDFGIINATPAVDDGAVAARSDAQAWEFNNELNADDHQAAQQLDSQMKQQYQQADSAPVDASADGSGTAADQLYHGDFKPWEGNPYYTE